MAKIQVQYVTGATVYALIRNHLGSIWNGTAFVAYSTPFLGTYDIPMTEQGTSGWYAVDFPALIDEQPEPFAITAYHQAGASPAESDVCVGAQDYYTEIQRATAKWEAPVVIAIPSAGSVNFNVIFRIIDKTGRGGQADASPTLDVTDPDGNSLVANVTYGPTFSSPLQGYKITYNVPAAHTQVPIEFHMSYVQDGYTRHEMIAVFAIDVFDYTADDVDANLIQIAGDSAAAIDLRDLYSLAIVNGSIVDATPSSTVFETGFAGSGRDDQFFLNAALVFTSGSLAGQTRRITNYTDSTGEITVDPAFTSTPANGDDFLILGRIE